jgi:hypothetical protein
MEMIKKFFAGVLSKLGEQAAAACAPLAATAIAWLMAPDTVAVSRGVVAGIAAGGSLLAFAIYGLGVRRGRRRAGAPRITRVDALQASVLTLLWANPHATLKFDLLLRILGQDSNTVRLACERLQARGFVAGNFYDSNTSVQLTNPGREYIDKQSLKARAEPPRAQSELAS